MLRRLIFVKLLRNYILAFELLLVLVTTHFAFPALYCIENTQSAQRLSLEKESSTEDVTVSLLCLAENFNKLFDLKTVFLPLMCS